MTLTNPDFVKLKKIFATKEDLKIFATKEDLKRFATKEDLHDFPTKTELKEQLQEHRSKLMNVLDKILKEIVAFRQTQEMMGYRVSKHETRITNLEDLHSEGKHVFA